MKRPLTCIVDSRVDIRDLATIHGFYVDKNIPILTKSSLIRQIVADFAHLMDAKHKVTSSAAAGDILTRAGLLTAGRASRSDKNHLAQIQTETVETISTSDDDEIDAIAKKLENLT